MFFRNIIDGNVILIIISSHYCLSYCPEWFLVEYEHVFDWSVRVLTALHLKATDGFSEDSTHCLLTVLVSR